MYLLPFFICSILKRVINYNFYLISIYLFFFFLSFLFIFYQILFCFCFSPIPLTVIIILLPYIFLTCLNLSYLSSWQQRKGWNLIKILTILILMLSWQLRSVLFHKKRHVYVLRFDSCVCVNIEVRQPELFENNKLSKLLSLYGKFAFFK